MERYFQFSPGLHYNFFGPFPSLTSVYRTSLSALPIFFSPQVSETPLLQAWCTADCEGDGFQCGIAVTIDIVCFDTKFPTWTPTQPGDPIVPPTPPTYPSWWVEGPQLEGFTQCAGAEVDSGVGVGTVMNVHGVMVPDSVLSRSIRPNDGSDQRAFLKLSMQSVHTSTLLRWNAKQTCTG